MILDSEPDSTIDVGIHEMRILRIISRMNTGGPAVQIVNLMNSLELQGVSQMLLAGECEPHELEYSGLADSKFQIVRIDTLSRRLSFFSDIATFFEIRKQIRRFGPTIIHTHTAKAGVLGRVASIGFRSVKLVHTFHGHLLRGYFEDWKTKFIILIERILAVRTDALVSVGEKVKAELMEKGIGHDAQYTVIPPGLSIPTIPKNIDARKTLEIPEDEFVVSWIGRLEPVKAPERILEVAEFFKFVERKVHFLIVGDGSEAGKLRETAREKGVYASFFGWRSDIENFLAVSDLMILTSLNEGMPTSLIQAQIAGVPVVTTDVGSCAEVIVHNFSGFVIPYEKNDFARLILQIMEKEGLSDQLSKCAIENATQKFSVKNMTAEYLNLYLNLTRQSSL